VTAVTDRPAVPAAAPPPRPRRGLAVLGLAVALVAGVALVVGTPHHRPAPPAGRVSLGAAWPRAQRADIPGNLRDGPLLAPLYFLDARTAVGTAPTPDAGAVRLVVRNPDGSLRELRRRPAAGNPQFDNVTAAAGTLAWTESTDGGHVEVWAADARGGPARRLTAQGGDAVFYGTQYDLVIAGGRGYWAAGSRDGNDTEIRSVALSGGPVAVRRETGRWGMTAWPWIVDGGPDNAGPTRLRNLVDGRETRVQGAGTALTTCSPSWCRVLVMSAAGLVRIDLMHPDGTARQRIAGSAAAAAVADVALLDRFEVLAEGQTDSALTGTERLLVYDLRTRRTVDVSAGVSGAFSRGGVLWWSTGDQDTLVWHTVDLRTV
jgi:hypothetical protein